MERPRQLRFWLLNLLPWTVYAVLGGAATAAFAGWWSGLVLLNLLLATGLYLASGVVRGLALSRGWFDRAPGALFGRLLAGVALGALALQLYIYVPLTLAVTRGWVLLPGDGTTRYDLPSLFGYWLNTAVVLALWVAVWAGWQAFARWRHGEIARLRAEAERSALELESLRARLNPHFVFNALNNLRALINEDRERARELVTRLSATLRHALDHGAAELVPLADELAVVDDYLAVEAVHYEDRLRVRRDLGPGAGEAMLPPMLLQLLVENAIKHGIARTPGGGELSLRAALDDGVLAVEVESPGSIVADAGGGVGLAYLRARLARLPRPGRFELRQAGDRVLARLEVPQ